MAKPELLHHPKLGRLAHALNARTHVAVGVLEMLWQHGAELGDPRVATAGDLAWIVDWPIDDADRLVDALCTAGLLDRDELGFVIHDFWHHAPRYAVRRHSARQSRVADALKASSSTVHQQQLSLPTTNNRKEKEHGAARRGSSTVDVPRGTLKSKPNVAVLTALTYDVLDVVDVDATDGDYREAAKWQAARHGLLYDGRSIAQALDQRDAARKHVAARRPRVERKRA